MTSNTARTRFRRGFTALTLVLAALALGAPARAAMPLTPPPDHVVVDLVTVNGSGCPEGTAAVSLSQDATAFTVTYSAYLARVGPGAHATEFRRNCQLGLRVHVPQGFTYAVAKADYRGYASLARGARAVEQASYYFQGATPTARMRHDFTGPYDGDWQKTDSVGVAALAWARCGAFRDLNINTELRVARGTSRATATSLISMDSTDTSFSTLYHLAWKRC
ncbi:DUF4360 domain-containing protein [Cryptosporangium japonicum]|uniref:DUF4360 domain-containing protein n=1 Tax=Cryptosporangium japonicum TaxID=80872 RepID=A0ABN0TXB7_9ACTN